MLLVPNAALRFTPETADAGREREQRRHRRRAGAAAAARRRRRRATTRRRSARGAQQTVYVWTPTASRRPISVTTGETNGTMTEVTGGDLKPGMKVITGQLSGKQRRVGTASGAGSGGAGSAAAAAGVAE